MRILLPMMVLLPLLASALCVLVGRYRQLQRVLGLSTLTAHVAMAVAITVRVDRDGTAVVQAGDWPAPIGITLVADRFSGIMLVTASTVLLAVLVYAIGQPGAERNHVGFQSVYLVLAAGVSAAFLTGDLFNLFVAIEMMLTASYVLITLGGRLDQVRTGMTYVVISLVASVLFLLALALTYASTGTVNMADLAERIASLPDGTRAALATLLVVVFGIKAALVPLHFWLPDSYPTAPTAVTAIFAGLLTKVGVYAIIRTQTLLFADDTRPDTLLVVVAALTMVIGVLGAVAQNDIKRILSFHIISQIGYMVLGLALFTLAGLAAAVLYIVHHIVVKTTLFLVGGLIEQTNGASKLSSLGGLVRTSPVIAGLFLVAALSLAGIPPFSGFAAKFAVYDATARSGQWVALAAATAVGLLTLFSMFKVWIGAFWSPPEDDDPVPGPSPDIHPTTIETDRSNGPVLMVLPTMALALVIVGIGLAAGPLYDLSERAAADLLNTRGYIEAVLGP